MMLRDVIDAVGPDTVKFLHSQLSQDIATMTAGEVRWSFLLQPTGKMVALLRVVRHADGDGVTLDTDAGHGDAVLAALSRFKIRTKCELSLRPSVPFAATWTARLPDLVEESAHGEPDDQFAAIAHGFPAWGAELGEGTIPNATGLVGDAVNFTKGCYTGQELVERIDSRGANLPRRLVGIDLAGASTVGDLFVDGAPAGTMTSVATDPSTGVVVALGYIARAVAIGDVVTSVEGVSGVVRDLS